MKIKNDRADPSASRETRFFEVNLIAMACGIWEWQVCYNQKPITCGYASTRKIAQFGGHSDLFLLLSLGRPV
jgi:hypothetical protein